jgi:putative Mg2+ transporter-C (MgtC) family protein
LFELCTVIPSDLNDFELAARLAAACACGGAIGLERDLRQMPTGLRTLALVCLGSAVAVIAAIKAGDSDGFSRVAQGIVTGVGFLGGGVILQKGELRDVKGLTTAAAIWLTAGVGLLCGLGEIKYAALATAFALVILVADTVIDPLIKKRSSSERNLDRGKGE